jgi:hypothetical protein
MIKQYLVIDNKKLGQVETMKDSYPDFFETHIELDEFDQFSLESFRSGCYDINGIALVVKGSHAYLIGNKEDEIGKAKSLLEKKTSFTFKETKREKHKEMPAPFAR